MKADITKDSRYEPFTHSGLLVVARDGGLPTAPAVPTTTGGHARYGTGFRIVIVSKTALVRLSRNAHSSVASFAVSLISMTA